MVNMIRQFFDAVAALAYLDKRERERLQDELHVAHGEIRTLRDGPFRSVVQLRALGPEGAVKCDGQTVQLTRGQAEQVIFRPQVPLTDIVVHVVQGPAVIRAVLIGRDHQGIDFGPHTGMVRVECASPCHVGSNITVELQDVRNGWS